LLLPHLFGEEYERILYLDSDLVIESGPFGNLFKIDMKGKAIAAVRDAPQWIDRKWVAPAFLDLGIPQAAYFNSGVMLIDTQAFVSSDLLNRCLAFGRQNRSLMTQHDQQLLNCVLHGDWVELSPLWNWQHTTHSLYADVMLPVIITHFITELKPWNDPEGRIPPRFKQALWRFLRRHFPQHPGIPIHKAIELSQVIVRSKSLRNFRRSWRFSRFLARFPDDLVAKT
jgi:lipopolysaccharide biosynthesis glycosyltransferase